MEVGDLKPVLTEGLRRLIVTEWDLAVVGANERTITSHLSRILHGLGVPWWLSVDHDYNRHLLNEKRAWLEVTPSPLERGIVPDIVIHRRGVDDDNLLAVEAKRAARCEPHDEAKVRALLREPYLYRAGLLLALGITASRNESYWEPFWCWMSQPEDEVDYRPVFDWGECAALNAEGKRLWEERLAV